MLKIAQQRKSQVKEKRQPSEWKKILATKIPTRSLYPTHTNSTYSAVSKPKQSNLKNQPKVQMHISPKKA